MTRKRSSMEAEEPHARTAGGLRGSEPQEPPRACGEGLEQEGLEREGLEREGPAQPGESESAASLAERLAQVEAERDEYLELLQRVQAGYDNYRKRAAREQERLIAHAHERIVRELLPVLDDLERALDAARRHEEAALVEGVQLVEKALRAALVKEGLAEIETDGPFDPHVHEAVLTQARGGAVSGSVLEVVQRGYRLGGKVVRPARVIVAE